MTAATPQPDAGTVVVLAPTVLDLVTCGDFAARIAEALAAGPQRLVLDLSAVEFCDSSGLRVLVRTSKSLRSTATALEMQSPTPAVRRLAAMTGATSLLGLPPDP